jgi:hypothetical protein
VDYVSVREVIYVVVFILNNMLVEFGPLKGKETAFYANNFAEELECPPKE